MSNYQLASSSWGEEEIEAINRVVASGFFTMGKEVKEYECAFADMFGAKYCVMTSSGSTANLLMVAALFFTKQLDKKLTRGDEIIVPAISWSTTYFPLQQYGLKIKFVDVDRHTLNYDLGKLKDAISDSTRALLAVNLLGNSCDYKQIKEIVANKDIVLLEDNCESMGAKFQDQYTGTFGLLGTFSSFFSHHIATMEGGCVITDDEEIYHILLCLRAHGWTRDLPDTNHVTGRKTGNAFDDSFSFALPGYNVRPLEMSGAIGKEQLLKLPSFVAQRRLNANKFKDLIGEFEFIDSQEEIGESSWFGFSLVLNESSDFTRESLIDALAQNGVECRPIVTGNFLKNAQVLEYFDYEVFSDPINADYIDRNGLFVGNHHCSIDDELECLHKALSYL